jgi:hypothetical protein
MPTHSDVPIPNKSEILTRLTKLEEKAKPNGFMRFMGHSHCRCCGINLGSGEFTFGSVNERHWVWPEGYAHYIVVHNVQPSPAFLEEVLGL